jgi:hypothetical protein
MPRSYMIGRLLFRNSSVSSLSAGSDSTTSVSSDWTMMSLKIVFRLVFATFGTA